jgi:hypothetical protein
MSTEKFLGRFLIATQSARGWINASFSTDNEEEARTRLAEMRADPGRGRDRLQDVALYQRIPPAKE